MNKKSLNGFIKSPFYKNKRANLSVLVFVMLALALMISVVSSFLYVNSKMMAILPGDGPYDSLYLKENLAEFYIWEAGELVLSETDFDLYPEAFAPMFKEQFLKYDFQDRDFLRLKEIILNDQFEVEIFQEGFLIQIGGWRLEDAKSFGTGKNDFLTVRYNPKIEVYVGEGYEEYSYLDYIYEDYNPIEVLPA